MALIAAEQGGPTGRSSTSARRPTASAPSWPTSSPPWTRRCASSHEPGASARRVRALRVGHRPRAVVAVRAVDRRRRRGVGPLGAPARRRRPRAAAGRRSSTTSCRAPSTNERLPTAGRRARLAADRGQLRVRARRRRGRRAAGAAGRRRAASGVVADDLGARRPAARAGVPELVLLGPPSSSSGPRPASRRCSSPTTDDGRFAGYAAGRVQPDGNGYIDFVAVDPRGAAGTGRRLVTGLVRRLLPRAPKREVHLTVQEHRTPGPGALRGTRLPARRRLRRLPLAAPAERFPPPAPASRFALSPEDFRRIDG